LDQFRSNDHSSNKQVLRPPHTRDAILGNLTVRIEYERALIGFNRLGAITGFFVGEPEASPGIGILVVYVKSGVEIFYRLVTLADSDQTLPAAW